MSVFGLILNVPTTSKGISAPTLREVPQVRKCGFGSQSCVQILALLLANYVTFLKPVILTF
jgi:hypothetical protein